MPNETYCACKNLLAVVKSLIIAVMRKILTIIEYSFYLQKSFLLPTSNKLNVVIYRYGACSAYYAGK
jgi:hypothetical protein